ncbi:hypothetical protein [Klenkia brasiliensis]|uniref:Excreted virulence factor EspC, type VII ESX diderm n=1 Tax=Klenkia brasiliensis TaxID=333142 RepID=A0A1G7QH26_9ACTN|nr:hypothetical protein [Klenkia brasiliensis]SDF97786.1 hypothetical protein SAMN05660324_1481 [Klenkia brasiliensis]
MSEGTFARPDKISDFGKQTAEQSQDLTSGLSSSMTGLMSANIGGSGFPEAALARSRYGSLAEASLRFVQDTAQGLTALGYAGITVAQNYREGDSEQQVLMDGVDAAFTPAPGQDSIARRAARAQQDAARAEAQRRVMLRRMGEDPDDYGTYQDGYDPTPTVTTTPANVCVAPTPTQQVQAHDDRAEEDGYDDQEAIDLRSEREEREQAAADPTPTPTPGHAPTPTTSGPTNSPSGSNGTGVPTATPGPSPTPSPTPSS